MRKQNLLKPGGLFLSTLSLRRATVSAAAIARCDSISIHALLAESDGCNTHQVGVRDDFYPRSPCGERRWKICGAPVAAGFLSTLSLRRATQGPAAAALASKVFLSTLSLRRATSSAKGTYTISNISIHALLAESDLV